MGITPMPTMMRNECLMQICGGVRFSDAAKTEQLRFDWAREREARIRKDLIALQREQVPFVAT